jgi:hypothetical protein
MYLIHIPFSVFNEHFINCRFVFKNQLIYVCFDTFFNQTPDEPVSSSDGHTNTGNKVSKKVDAGRKVILFFHSFQ